MERGKIGAAAEIPQPSVAPEETVVSNSNLAPPTQASSVSETALRCEEFQFS